MRDKVWERLQRSWLRERAPGLRRAALTPDLLIGVNIRTTSGVVTQSFFPPVVLKRPPSRSLIWTEIRSGHVALVVNNVVVFTLAIAHTGFLEASVLLQNSTPRGTVNQVVNRLV